MKKVELKCLCDFKYGESGAEFRKNEKYTAIFENGLYSIENEEESVILENLLTFFEVQEDAFRKFVRSSRKYTSKEEVCKRMGWEDFSIGGVTVLPDDLEKVGMAQYAVNLKEEK